MSKTSKSFALTFVIAVLCLAPPSVTRAASDESAPSNASASGFHAGRIGVAGRFVNTIIATDKDVRKAGVGTALGFGADLAVSVTRRSNVRLGVNVASTSRSLTRDGITFRGDLRLRSAQALFDIFPFGGGFHLSPGVMFYNGNHLDAMASTAARQSFTVGGTSYTSSAASPIEASGKMTMNAVAPLFLVGYGNVIPRTSRHWSFLVEAGVAYQGMPKVKLNFTGSACDASGVNCIDAATNPLFLANVSAEEAKLRHDASAFRFLPTISLGVGYRFGGTR